MLALNRSPFAILYLQRWGCRKGSLCDLCQSLPIHKKNFVGALTTHKSEQYPRALRKSMKLAYTRRFWSLLSVAALKGITASVEGIGEIDDSGSFLQMPHFEEVLAGLDIPPEVSRLA